MIAVQYLEPGPGLAEVTPTAARRRLRLACERLPISDVILGWNLPARLLDACAEEIQRQGARIFLWRPLLAGDGVLQPEPAWLVVGLDGERVPGFQGRNEFTFICPNKSSVRQAVLNHLDEVLQANLCQGVFLDRIRFPSPSASPDRLLACFCPDCQAAAAQEGLDLAVVRRILQSWTLQPGGKASLLRCLLNGVTGLAYDGLAQELDLVIRWMQFRKDSITWMAQAAAGLAAGRGLSIGLDCFSPCLTGMVGQDLASLMTCCDWIKVMTYAHTFAPAGLPFELSNLSAWLQGDVGLEGESALCVLADITGLPLGLDLESLRQDGLTSQALGAELRQARAMGVSRLLAGIELVDVPGVTCLNPSQIRADLAEINTARADGLVLSWDLWRIPLDRLDLIDI